MSLATKYAYDRFICKYGLVLVELCIASGYISSQLPEVQLNHPRTNRYPFHVVSERYIVESLNSRLSLRMIPVENKLSSVHLIGQKELLNLFQLLSP